jgi:hypothetical protein
MFLLTLLIISVFGYDPNSWLPPIWDETCSFSREDVRKGMEEYIDVNPKDNQITAKEIDEALQKYKTWYLKPVLLIYNSKDVMRDCDYDKNGVITPRDFMLTAKTCFPNKASWCTIQWFYDNIKNGHLG